MKQIETQIGDEIIRIPKWKYILNWWSPVIGVVSMIIVGAVFFSDLRARIFDSSDQKYKVIEHVNNQEIHLTRESRDELVTHKEFQEMKLQLSEIKSELKELNKYLREHKRRY